MTIVGRETSPKELYAVVAVIAIPFFYFAGAGSTVFWIVGTVTTVAMTVEVEGCGMHIAINQYNYGIVKPWN